MTTSAIFSDKFSDNAVNVGVPLLVIAVWCQQAGVPVGNYGALFAAALAAVFTTVFARFGRPAVFKALGVSEKSRMAVVYHGALNAALAAAALAVASSFKLF